MLVINTFFDLVCRFFAAKFFHKDQAEINSRRGTFSGNQVAVNGGIVRRKTAAEIRIHRRKTRVFFAF